MLPAILAAVGATVALGSMYGASKEKGPKEINVEYEPDPMQAELDKLTMGILKDKLLPMATNDNDLKYVLSLMNSVDIKTPAIKKDFAGAALEIETKIQQTATQQAGEMFGRKIEEEGRRIGLSEDQIQRQKDLNTQKTNQAVSVLSKQVEAWGIKAGRDYGLKRAFQDMDSASLIAKAREGAQNIFTSGVNAMLGRYSTEAEQRMGLSSALSRANTQTNLETWQTKQKVGLQGLMGLGEAGLSTYEDYQDKKYVDAQWARLNASTTALTEAMTRQ